MLSFLNGLTYGLTFFFKRKVCYSAIDVGTFQNIPKNFRAQFRAGPERGINLESSK